MHESVQEQACSVKLQKDSDCKRFCTLNLPITMAVNSDGTNVMKPHVVFAYEKIQKMKDWDCNPFTSFRVLAVNKNKTVWRLHLKAVAITCSKCPKKGNAKCVFGLCKGCCLEKQQAESVSCKAHKLVVAAAAAAGGGGAAASASTAVPQQSARRHSKRAKTVPEPDFHESDESDEDIEELLDSEEEESSEELESEEEDK